MEDDKAAEKNKPGAKRKQPSLEEKDAALAEFVRRKTTAFDKILSAIRHFDGKQLCFDRDAFHRDLVWRAMEAAQREIDELKKKLEETGAEKGRGSVRRRRTVALALSASFLLALAVFHPVWLGAAGRFLRTETPLQKADLIYMFGSQAKYRAPHAAKLLEEGWADRIMVSGQMRYSVLQLYGHDVNDARLNAAVLERAGVPREKIIAVEKGTSTAEELVNVKLTLRENGWKSVILVSSDFHMRRLRLVAPVALNDPGTKIFYSPTKQDAFELDRWWTSEEGLVSVNNEYIKLAWYFFKFKLLKRIPPDDYTAKDAVY